jgi:uncharacterized protein YjbI with pentapeptide repeats
VARPNPIEDNAWLTADLSHARLRSADLRRAIPRDALLIGTDLSVADLTGADLRRADLSGAHMAATDVTGADLSGARPDREQLIGAVHDDTTTRLRGFHPPPTP